MDAPHDSHSRAIPAKMGKWPGTDKPEVAASTAVDNVQCEAHGTIEVKRAIRSEEPGSPSCITRPRAVSVESSECPNQTAVDGRGDVQSAARHVY